MQGRIKRRRLIRRLATGLSAAGLVLASAAASAQQPPMPQNPAVPPMGQAPAAQPGEVEAAFSVTAGEIAKNPGNYRDRRVAVRAEVEDVFNAHLFTLDEDRLFAGPDVLVLVQEPTAQVPEGSKVLAVGTIRFLRSEELQQRFDWFKPDMVSGLPERPVLVADSVRSERGVEYVRGRPSAEVLFVRPELLARSPAQFYGRTVSLRARIDAVHSDNLFRLDSGPLVVLPRPAGQVKKGDTVTLIGSVRPGVITDLQREYQWIDFDRDIAEEIGNRGVIVAESIETREGYELVQQEPRTAEGEAMIAMIVLSPDKQSLVGQAVRLEGVRVADVTSERSFLITTAGGQRLPVVLAEGSPALTGLRAGDQLTINGIVMGASPGVQQTLNLTGRDMATLSGQQLFLYATRANILGAGSQRAPQQPVQPTQPGGT